jgi:hypothetical protein
MPRLELCRRASPSFLAVVALPSLLVRHPCALPSRQTAPACVLLSACIFLPRGFAIAARANALVLPRRFKWLALALCRQLAFFAVAALLLLCVRRPRASPSQQMGRAHTFLSARVLCPCSFAVSARALPSRQIALARALPSACVLRPHGFAVAACVSRL